VKSPLIPSDVTSEGKIPLYPPLIKGEEKGDLISEQVRMVKKVRSEKVKSEKVRK
jgi:hypothetical protein